MIDYEPIRKAYVEVPKDSKRPTYKALAEEFSVSAVSISRKAIEEDWKALAEEWDLMAVSVSVLPPVTANFQDEDAEDFDAKCLRASRMALNMAIEKLHPDQYVGVRELEIVMRTIATAQSVGMKAMGKTGDLNHLWALAQENIEDLSDHDLRLLANDV